MRDHQKVAIVTGGARGIGRGCALRLAQSGCNIVLIDLLEPEMKSTSDEIRKLGSQCITFSADVADHQVAADVVRDVHTHFGRLDVLVNNAGKSMPVGIREITEDQWDQTININLKSCFNWIQPSAEFMLSGGSGRIVSMSSLNAHSGGVTAAVSKFAYAAAKAGIIGMTRALAKELGPQILINAICPGLIKTEVAKNPVIVDREAELIKGIAAKRVGTPKDVAELVGFLCLSEPCFITGQDFIIDGFQWNR